MNATAPLFTFGVITDTHIRPPDLDASSPFPVNDRANGRARHAIGLLAGHQPEFVLHLGDMVHTLPHMPTYGAACREALSIFEPLRDRMHFMPGNHDIGDKPSLDSPADPVTPQTVEVYAENFGDTYRAFAHHDCLFVLMNASLVNSGTELELAQRDWLETTLANAQGKRIFLCSHYPPFIDQTSEQAHYDNYSEPGRSWLLGLLKRHAVEAVFSGHVHQFFYNRLGDARLYCLPPVSFIRQDYAELYHVGPTAEYGRDDPGKYSVALVDVFADGHRLRVIPTDGREAGPGRQAPSQPAPVPRGGPLTVHLRHAWAQTTDLPYNGPMEEFARKRARNDYTLLRLWQTGIRNVRVPLTDLADPAVRTRVADYHAAGIRFSFFCIGVPDAQGLSVLLAERGLVDQLEIVTAQPDLSDLAGLDRLSVLGDLPILVGKSHSSKAEAKENPGAVFAHSVSYGFRWSERDAAAQALSARADKPAGCGLVFQVGLEDDVRARLEEIDAFASRQGLKLAANLRLAAPNPANANFDDALIRTRIEQALEAAETLSNTQIQVDTFADVDRGYHPRHGLVDRHSNLRPAGRMLAGLPDL